MKSTTKFLTIFKLIAQAFKNTNQVFGSGLALTAVFVICSTFVYILIKLIPVVLPLNKGIFVFMIPVAILSVWLHIAYSMGLLQIIDSSLKKSDKTIIDAVTDSCLPAIYCLLDVVIFAVPFYFLTSKVYPLLTTPAALLTYTALIGFILLPFLFTPAFLALREEGPIASLQYSCQFFREHYKFIFLVLIQLILLSLILRAIFYGGLTILLPAAASSPMQFFLIKLLSIFQGNVFLFKITAFLIFGIFYLYMTLFSNSIYVLLFFHIEHLDQANNGQQHDSLESEEKEEIIFSPEEILEDPVEQTSSNLPSDAHVEQGVDQLPDTLQPAQPPIPPEEDEIPALLLDEKMSQQLEENERKMQQQQKQSANAHREEDDPGSIRISDKTL